jgi:spermidine synthase
MHQNTYAAAHHNVIDTLSQPARNGKWKAGTPIVIENDLVVSLYFDARGVQSTMFIADPYALALGYTRTMAGFFLFQPAPRRIWMIGLGGGSLAKYCHRHSPQARIVAVEINPEVIDLRDRFHVPRDDERFEVVCANGANYVKSSDHRPDVILVDGFTADGLPPELATAAFYANCRARMSDDGIFVANLVTDEPNFHRNLRTLKQVFGDTVALAPSEGSPNNVTAFAWKNNSAVPSYAEMLSRATAIASSHSVNLHATATRIERGKKFDWSPYQQARWASQS